MNLGDVFAHGLNALKKEGLIEYRLETEILLVHTLKVERTYLIAHPEKKLTKKQERQFKSYISRRLKREPIAYIIKKAYFMSFEFYVDKNVLIPRPETELLVENAIEAVSCQPSAVSHKVNILDLGTGSGIIAISLAKYLPQAKITATDHSKKALAIARKNAKTHKAKIKFLYGDLFKPIKNRKFDLIISNPPYVSDSEYNKTSPQVKYEPKKALLAGKDGLDVIRKIIKEAKHHLNPNGKLMLEIGYEQGKAVIELAKKENYTGTKVNKDYQGLDRIVIASQPECVFPAQAGNQNLDSRSGRE